MSLIELESLKTKKLAVLIHKEPDLDAIGSATLIKDIFINIGNYLPEDVVIVGNLTYKYKQFLDPSDIKTEIGKKWDDYDVCVVDTPSPIFLSKEQRSILKGGKSIWVFDHHLPNRDSYVKLVGEERLNYHNDPEMPSCCEFIWKSVLDKDKTNLISQKALNLVLAGIFNESNEFVDCNDETFKVVAELINLGGDAKKLFRTRMRSINSWEKMTYVSEVMKSASWDEESKLVVLHTWFNQYRTYVRYMKLIAFKKPPIFVLTNLRLHNIKFKKTMHAYLLVYDIQKALAIRFNLILDLFKWSKERQDALNNLGFKVCRSRQYRFYRYATDTQNCNDIINQIKKVLSDTENSDLEDVF